MKLLILNDFFNYNNDINSFLKIFYKNYKNYNKIKLNRLIKNFKKIYGNNIEFKLITNSHERSYVHKDVEVELLSEFRLKLDREDYLNILKKVNEKTKSNLRNLYYNLLNLKTFHINGIFIGRLLENDIILYLNKIFTNFEMLKKILQIVEYDKVIMFNFNPDFLDFFRYLYSKFKNIEVYKDPILNKKRIQFNFRNFFSLLLNSLKGHISKKFSMKISNENRDRVNILFFGEKTKKSIHTRTAKPIYEYLKTNEIFNPIYYHTTGFIPLKKLFEFTKFFIQIRKILFKNKIVMKLEYESLKINNSIMELCNYELLFTLYYNYYHFDQFVKKNYPNLVVFTDDTGMKSRLFAKYCLIKNIPTVYIPHGKLETYFYKKKFIHEEFIMKTDINYYALAGEYDKKFLVSKGEDEDKLVVTGKPILNQFLEQKIDKLSEINDMFDNRTYKFEPNKFTILLTTNPDDDKSLEKIILTVINSLKELNLVENLIIKIHPRENGRIQKKIVQELKIKPIVVKDCDIYRLIISCDLTLNNKFSSTILESLAIGTPVVLLDLINLRFDISFERFLKKAIDQRSLTEILRKLINNRNFYREYSKKVKETSKEYIFYDESESATERIVNLIRKIINNNKQKK